MVSGNRYGYGLKFDDMRVRVTDWLKGFKPLAGGSLKIVRYLFGFFVGLVIGDVLLDNEGMFDDDERGQWQES